MKTNNNRSNTLASKISQLLLVCLLGMQLPSFAQGDAFAYTPPATLGSLREAQSVMEYFTAGTLPGLNLPGFVQF
jgi:hypothetical protein